LGIEQVIVLDTHIWVWWVQGDPRLPPTLRGVLEANEKGGLGVSIISVLEVARLVAYSRLTLPLPLLNWAQQALTYPHIELVELSPEIAIESTQLPGEFHKDPCDRIIVATARHFDWPLATTDGLIERYPHVRAMEYDH
jgi:PIN domain nuclease of toxin-antitoxin system